MTATAFLRVPSNQPFGDDLASRTAASDHRRRQSILHTVPALMHETWQRWRSRRDLTALDDCMLRDIGITRAEVQHELSKPFWRT
jgi:uncharacterized protein YjiS (DUF1127 family)